MFSYGRVYQICLGTNSALVYINYSNEIEGTFLPMHFKVKLGYTNIKRDYAVK